MNKTSISALFLSAALIGTPMAAFSANPQLQFNLFMGGCAYPDGVWGDVSGVQYDGTRVIEFGSADSGEASSWWYKLDLTYRQASAKHPELNEEVETPNGTRSLTADRSDGKSAVIECYVGY